MTPSVRFEVVSLIHSARGTLIDALAVEYRDGERVVHTTKRLKVAKDHAAYGLELAAARLRRHIAEAETR